jgi:hypothetical protein
MKIWFFYFLKLFIQIDFKFSTASLNILLNQILYWDEMLENIQQQRYETLPLTM